MYKVLQVSIDDQGRANQYAYANWDVQGGWNTFTSPVFGEGEELVGFRCGIKLPDDAEIPDYMIDETFAEIPAGPGETEG